MKMRAQNEQELIYKRGQTGITKASEIIVFDNSDRAGSPDGLESQRPQESDAHNSDNVSRRSIEYQQPELCYHARADYKGIPFSKNELPTDRPSKSSTCGHKRFSAWLKKLLVTRMFEDRKDKAKKITDKKEKRVGEMEDIRDEITPKLDKLRAGQRSY